jgi:hypothetical protein
MTKKTIRSADRLLARVDRIEQEKIQAVKSNDGWPDEFSVRAFAVLARAIEEIHTATNTQATVNTAAKLSTLKDKLQELMAIKDRAEALRLAIKRGELARLEDGW